MEDLGKAADTLDNLIAAMELPLPPEMHLSALKSSLPRLRDTLRDIYCTKTGDNPWKDSHD
jgi:hypothetical protein